MVLEKFNLQIKPGQMIAFVGETGSGKSTIINLISRFYEPTSGEIRIDNKDYKKGLLVGCIRILAMCYKLHIYLVGIF